MSTSSLHLQRIDPLDSDARLMLQVRNDVAGAFESLVERYQHRLLCILLHVVGSADAAEDLTQDVFLRVYKARKSYTPRAKFSTWLFTIAHNLAMNYLRGRGRNRVVPLESGGGEDSSGARPAEKLASIEPTASAQMRSVELSEVVREAIDRLGEDQRIAVLLNKFEELGYAEIGEVMGRSEAAIKSLLARARYNLKERLEPYLRSGQRPD